MRSVKLAILLTHLFLFFLHRLCAFKMWAQRWSLQSENRYITSKRLIVYVHGVFFHLIGLKFHQNINSLSHLLSPVFFCSTLFGMLLFFAVMIEVTALCLMFWLERKHCKHHVCWINIKQTERKCVTLCVHRLPMSGMAWGWRTVVTSSTWTLTLISNWSISINFCPCP